MFLVLRIRWEGRKARKKMKMQHPKLEPFLVAAGFLGLVAFIAVVLSSFAGCNDGRNHGANIPIDPTCVELVTDECVPEVIEEFCDVCPPPVICPPPVVCPPDRCFVKHVEKVCIKERWGRCCEWDKVITFEPIDCPEPEDIEVP